ncbi:predicted protein [Plenodomus lingam JN3]|uniref:Predicted protein n=1 Tax=Leptosphaeria maculans (strain JN3 / isolate v23.1.3 / race Av1-4-5-6-7-8) TaxID=985895 RepID=E5A070_LEPMJ|nr:predicted protein [Plenodomus lingam JN3]CBX96930.1 predicted protein [Plenodomus lingam JN3]
MVPRMERRGKSMVCLVQGGSRRSDPPHKRAAMVRLTRLYHGFVAVTLSRAAIRLALGRTNPHIHFGAAPKVTMTISRQNLPNQSMPLASLQFEIVQCN